MWDDEPVNVTSEVNFIWSIANKLRGPYRSDKYKDVIIPMVIIRRLECALEDTKEKVLARFDIDPDLPTQVFCRTYSLYNVSACVVITSFSIFRKSPNQIFKDISHLHIINRFWC